MENDLIIPNDEELLKIAKDSDDALLNLIEVHKMAPMNVVAVMLSRMVHVSEFINETDTLLALIKKVEYTLTSDNKKVMH